MPFNPKSLENLAPPWDTERARKAQANSVKARKANKEAREHLKLSMKDWKQYKEDVLDVVDMSAVDVLKILMMKSLDAEDHDTAAELAKSIAEFEQPKLARVDSVVETKNATDMTDEELEAKLKELGLEKGNSNTDS